MTQLWFNAWHKKEMPAGNGEPKKRVCIEGDACLSYDDAMEELEDYSSSWRRQGWSYFGTYCHEIDAQGKTVKLTFYDDLDGELERWIEERDADAKAYREAATLSAHQLCDVGRVA